MLYKCLTFNIYPLSRPRPVFVKRLKVLLCTIRKKHKKLKKYLFDESLFDESLHRANPFALSSFLPMRLNLFRTRSKRLFEFNNFTAKFHYKPEYRRWILQLYQGLSDDYQQSLSVLRDSPARKKRKGK